jgi:hypothetical protein
MLTWTQLSLLSPCSVIRDLSGLEDGVYNIITHKTDCAENELEHFQGNKELYYSRICQKVFD